MKMKELFATILSLIMVMSLFVPVFSTVVFADEAKEEDEQTFDYLGTPFTSAEDKLDTMLLYFENEEYAIYGRCILECSNRYRSRDAFQKDYR